MSGKNVLYFRKWNFLAPSFKNLQRNFQNLKNQNFLYFSKKIVNKFF